MKYTDSDIQEAVSHELRWIPGFKNAKFDVSVTDGVATLSGHVATYPERLWAERATHRIHGVTGVVMQLSVGDTWVRISDTEIADVVRQALHRAVDVPDSVAGEVKNRVVTLSGEVPWQWQKLAASRSVQYLRGVDGVDNAIEIVPNLPPVDLRTAIGAAFARSAQLDGLSIGVTTGEHGVVSLRGVVDSRAQWRQAEHTCWAAPGVRVVDNQLRVRSASSRQR